MMASSLPLLSSSSTHLVLIPSYNPGPRLLETVQAARAAWNPVWVVVDGSTDGSTPALLEMAADDVGIYVIVLPINRGKGAAVLCGLHEAAARGFTHALTMDADGQHPHQQIAAFMAESMKYPAAMILGKPIFASDAPALRVKGREVSNWWANVETLWAGIGDSLFGFRVYPIAPLRDVMRGRRWMRRFDFDPEVVVRLCWYGVVPINLPAAVRYFKANEGGVSHFRYLRDNTLLTWMHTRLFLGFLWRLPRLLALRHK